MEMTGNAIKINCNKLRLPPATGTATRTTGEMQQYRA